MSDDDYELPDLPSDEDLGITEEDLKAIEEEEAAAKRAASVDEAGGRGGGTTTKAPPAGPPPKRKPAPPAPGGSRGHAWRGPVTLLFMLVLGWATSGNRILPDAVGPAAPDSVFASGRAMLDMVAKAREAHPPGSPAHDRVREMLQDRLVELGLAPEVQTATSVRRRGNHVATATVRNVLARLPGTGSTGAILLTAHYDGRGISRAAGDDGAGVSAILETLRALRTGPRLQNDVLVLLTDGEELGLLGARAFVADHPWMEDIAVVLSVEMRGGGGPSIMFETGSENGWIVDAYGAGSPRPFANSLGVEVYRRMPNDTDFSPFRDLGVQGLNFAGIGNAHVYHQAWDEPGRFDERTLQHHGVQLLGVVRELGGRDLSNVDAPDRVYFTVPVFGLITYSTAVGYGLAMLLLLAFVAVFILVGRRGGDADTGTSGPIGVLAGLLLAVLSMGISAGAAYGLFLWTRALHPEYGSLHGSAFHVETWYAAALVALSGAVTVFLLALFRKRVGLGPLAVGAAFPAVVGAIFLSFAAPLAGHNLQWPALLALAGAVLVVGVHRHRRPGVATWIGLLFFAVGIFAIAVPLTGFTWLALTFGAAPILGALIALWFLLLLPLLDTLREPGGGWAPLLGLVASAIFVGVGLLHARPSPERPAPSSLVYVVDRDSAGPVWGTRDGPGSEWAESRAGELDVTRYFEYLGLPSGAWRSGPAPTPAAGIPLPGVTVRTGEGAVAGGDPIDELAAGRDGPGGDSDEAGPGDRAGDAAPGVSPRPDRARRTLSLAVRSRAGAEHLRVSLPASADVYLRRVNGQDVPDEDPGERSGARRATTVGHWGRPVEDEGLLLTLDVGPSVEDLELEVVEHHMRPGELVGQRYFLRPPSLAPDITAASDRAVLRTTVAVSRAGDVRFFTRRVRADGAAEAVPDTAGAESDTAGAAGPDTSGLATPGAAAPGARTTDTAGTPDTTVVPDPSLMPDTAGATPDPDTVSPPDTSGAPDTGGALPPADSTATGPPPGA